MRLSKLAGLLRGGVAVEFLQRATEVVARVPAYTLRYPRDLGRLTDVASEIARWHRG